MTNSNAFFEVIMPAGISLTDVRVFFASKFLSSQRLNAMAAERAKIMQRMTSMNILNKVRISCGEKTSVCQPGTTECGVEKIPKKNPINAKGIAKMVWENFTSDK